MQHQQSHSEARLLAPRISDVLSTWVQIQNKNGSEVAYAYTGHESGSGDRKPPATPYLRLELRLHPDTLYISVGPPHRREASSPEASYSLIEAVVRKYSARASTRPEHEVRNAFIRALLTQSPIDEKAISRAARSLGIDLAQPRLVFLLDASSYILAPGGPEKPEEDGAAWRAKAMLDAACNYLKEPQEAACGYLGEGVVVLLKTSGPGDDYLWAEAAEDHRREQPRATRALLQMGTGLIDKLNSDLQASVHLALGRGGLGIEGVRSSYRDALVALRVGRALSLNTHLYTLPRLVPDGFLWLADAGLKRELACQLLSPLDSDPELARTLQIFFDENCSPAAAADKLVLHRNSLYYRLDKITELVGCDPRHIEDASGLLLAMRICQNTNEPSALSFLRSRSCAIFHPRPPT